MPSPATQPSIDRASAEFDRTEPDLTDPNIEPDFWLDDADLLPATDPYATDVMNDVALRNDPEFFEANTEPGVEPRTSSVDALAATIPDGAQNTALTTRDDVLASFLDTVRRVLGKSAL